MPKQRRLYIGNLPPSATEDAITTKFKLLGKIAGIDLRRKNDSVYSFIDVVTSDPIQLNSAIKKYNNMEWDGCNIKIEPAKENFLDKLQKERENSGETSGETASHNGHASDSHFDVHKGSVPMFHGMSELCHDDEEKPKEEFKTKIVKRKGNYSKNVLSSFESFCDSWKDYDETAGPSVPQDKKIKRLKTDVQEEYIPSKKLQKETKSFSKIAKHTADDGKRLASLSEKIKFKNQQQKLVKDALNLVDSITKRNNKIIFNDDEAQPDDIITPVKTKNQLKLPLMGDSDNDDEDLNEIKVQTQFEGKKGQKLLALQSRMNHDDRFKLDKRFIESDNEEEELVQTVSTADCDEDNNLTKEREHQLKLLGDVLGHSIDKSAKSSKTKSIQMLRFDPTKPDHSQYIKKEGTKPVSVSEKPKRVRIVNPVIPVSGERFYNVTESISQTFQKDNTFSVLQMLGREDTGSKDEPQGNILTKVTEESKEESDDGEEEVEEKKHVVPETKSVHVRGIWQESLFFQPNDGRLLEGFEFINKLNSEESKQVQETYPDTRRELNSIFKTQMKKSNRKKNPFKNKIGGGRKFKNSHKNNKFRFKK